MCRIAGLQYAWVLVMINYIKMDLFRLFKSVSFYVCSAVLLLMIGMTILEVRSIEKTGREQWMEEAGVSETKDDPKDEIVVGGVGIDSLKVADEGTVGGCMNAIYNGNVMAFIVLLIVSIFICNEYSGGYIKNTITIPKYRWYFNISKLVTASVVIVIENILAVLAFILATKFVFKDVVIGDITQLIGYLALEALLLLGMAAIVMLICNIIRSKAVGIIFSLLMAFQVVVFPILIVCCTFLKFKYETVAKFLMTLASKNIAPGLGRQTVIETLALAAGALLIYTLLSNLVISKKDIG